MLNFIAVFHQAAVIDGLLIPSGEATSLCAKYREVTFCCGSYDPGFIQAKKEKVCIDSFLQRVS